MQVIHQPGTNIILRRNGIERLCYHYQLPNDPSPSAPKPYIHPIRTADGIEITADAPLDHFWHRGIWFAWKYVNGVNYWEENQEIVGRQITVAPPTLEPLPDTLDGIRWISDVDWRDTKDGVEKTRLHERRTVAVRFLLTGETGNVGDVLQIDWHSRQMPTEDTLLDRTPFTTWGGYGGLVVRLTQALQKQQILFDDGTQTDHPKGEPHSWGGIHGQLDTGKNRHTGVVFFPSPKNFRTPEPFYGNAKAFYNFFGPAPLFYEPFLLRQGEILNYTVRILIFAQPLTTEGVSRYYRAWLEQEGR
jgi:hypothetical protein